MEVGFVSVGSTPDDDVDARERGDTACCATSTSTGVSSELTITQEDVVLSSSRASTSSDKSPKILRICKSLINMYAKAQYVKCLIVAALC